MFISFEGGDGAGKTTQIQILADQLTTAGFEVVTTREPGGTPLGKHIRELLLHGSDMGSKAEALLYAADRAHHVASLVRPALAAGKIVLTDRYLDSSVAYQGAARSLGKEEVRDLSLWATDGLMPDLTLLLDLPPAEGRKRVGKNLDRIEAAGEDFHEAVRREFLAMAQAQPQRWAVVDASASVRETASQVRGYVMRMLKEAGRLTPEGHARPVQPTGDRLTP